MYRVSARWAHAALPVLSASFLLSGCMTVGPAGPAALGGGGMHRSIKDDPEPVIGAPAPKYAPASKSAVVVPPARPQPPRTPPRADVPSCASGSECMVRLKAMIDDPSRSWIGQPQPPAEYANGTRLFAYRALHAQLTCPQLTAALGEIETADKIFKAGVPGVTALQAKRILALNAEVEGELRSEVTSRCKG